MWAKVMWARSVQAVQFHFLQLFESSIPQLLKQRLRYWYSKIHRWGGAYIKRVFTANFKGECIFVFVSMTGPSYCYIVIKTFTGREQYG